MSLLKGWRLGRLSQWLFPHFSSCGRCHTTWNIVEGHTISYCPTGGMFALCEECWRDLLPTERLPFYHRTWLEWRLDALRSGYEPKSPSEWHTLESNILEGK